MKQIFIVLILIASAFAQDYSFRKYKHVENFYEFLAPKAIEVGLEYNVPPAAILAIAGLESGYGQGYVAKITGNILSLGAWKGDKTLPPLYLPTHVKTNMVIYDPDIIKKYESKKEKLLWKKRPPSLKRDYRPVKFAGTKDNLEYFSKHKKEFALAEKACLIDFSSRWISKTRSKHLKPFIDTRIYLDKLVKEKGQEVLFTTAVNKRFINMLGGKKYSFNYRKTWPKKVNNIMKKVGLVELCKKIYFEKKNFKEAWSK